MYSTKHCFKSEQCIPIYSSRPSQAEAASVDKEGCFVAMVTCVVSFLPGQQLLSDGFNLVVTRPRGTNIAATMVILMYCLVSFHGRPSIPDCIRIAINLVTSAAKHIGLDSYHGNSVPLVSTLRGRKDKWETKTNSLLILQIKLGTQGTIVGTVPGPRHLWVRMCTRAQVSWVTWPAGRLTEWPR